MVLAVELQRWLDEENSKKMGWMTRKTFGQLWRKFEEAGFEKKDGVYDTRDWESIRKWIKELAHKALSNK